MTTTVEPEYDHASGLLQDMIRRNRNGEKFGLYAVCSAHPSVVDAAMRQSMENGSVLLVESTSSQVNQFGVYTGQTPDQFAEFVHCAAQQAGLPRQRVLPGAAVRNHSAEGVRSDSCLRACGIYEDSSRRQHDLR